MSGLGFIAQEPDDTCEMCGQVDELRPYGPNYERICFECGMKNEELTQQRCHEYIFGVKKSLVQ
jgi:hypothetical protein